MNLKDMYHGQVVTEAHLDAAFQYVEDMEHLLAVDAGLAAVGIAASPDPTIYGGIQSGGAVTKNAAKKVNVAATIGRDSSGRYVYCPASTVMLTRIGATAEGDSVDAVGTGALVAITNECWLSLWLVYDESLTDLQVDATGSTVYFDIEESFHFHLELGTDAAGATVPAALVNNRLLLADILLDSAEEIATVGLHDAICGTNEDFDDLGAPYNGMSGRRADWLALEEATAFPLYAAANTQLRSGTARAAFYQLVQQLQRQAVPAGGHYVGMPAVVGTGAVHNAFSATTLAQGSVASQLEELLNVVNNKMARGGDTMRPAAGANGIVFDPTNMQADEVLMNVRAHNMGALQHYLRIGKKRGHLCIPHIFFDDFNARRGTNVGGRNAYVPDTNDPWYVAAVGANSNAFIRNQSDGVPYLGGILELFTHPVLNSSTTLIYGFNAVDVIGGWDASTTGIVFHARIRIPDVTNIIVFFEMLNNAAGASGSIRGYLDTSVDAAFHGIITDHTGVFTNAVSLIAPMLPNVWYTIRCAVTGTGDVIWQVNNGIEVGTTVAPAVLGAGNWIPRLYCKTLANPGSREAYFDQVYVSDGALAADAI